MKERNFVCAICGSTEIKEKSKNRFGREMTYYSNFGRKEYCSVDCYYIGIWKRQRIWGIGTMIFSVLTGSFLMYLEIVWETGWMMVGAVVMTTLIGSGLGYYILTTGKKGKRLKEERDFKSFDGSQE